MRRGRQRKFKERREGEEEARPRRPLDPEKARTRTLQRAVKLLAAKPRSVEELRERLLEKEWTDGGDHLRALEAQGVWLPRRRALRLRLRLLPCQTETRRPPAARARP